MHSNTDRQRGEYLYMYAYIYMYTNKEIDEQIHG